MAMMQKLELYILKNTGEEPIHGAMAKKANGDIVQVWSVFDFLCVVADKKTKTNYGRVTYSNIYKKYKDQIKGRTTNVHLGKGANTTTMEAADLQWLLYTKSHAEPHRAVAASNALACNEDGEYIVRM
jgi:hypothetical protein